MYFWNTSHCTNRLMASFLNTAMIFTYKVIFAGAFLGSHSFYQSLLLSTTVLNFNDSIIYQLLVVVMDDQI